MCQAMTAKIGRSLADSAASAALNSLSRLKLSNRSQFNATIGSETTTNVPITAVRQTRDRLKASTTINPSASPSHALRVNVQ